MLTRKHFKALAVLIKKHAPQMSDEFINDLSEWLKSLNPRFDRDIFLAACGRENAKKAG